MDVDDPLPHSGGGLFAFSGGFSVRGEPLPLVHDGRDLIASNVTAAA
jgi:hypothetical protein